MSKKLTLIFMSLILVSSSLYPSIGTLNVKADNIIRPLEFESRSDSDAKTSSSSGEGGVGGGGGGEGGGAESSAVCEFGLEPKEVSYAPPSGDSFLSLPKYFNGGDISISVEANASASSCAQAIILMGSEMNISAYLVESLQGRYGGTFIPDINKFIESEKNFEWNTAALKEDRYFSQENKAESIYNIDEFYSLEYIEALNWLYKNNYLHNIEELNITFEENKLKNDKNTSHSASPSGGAQEYVKSIRVSKDKGSITYDMLSVPDSLTVYNSKGQKLLDTGYVSGPDTVEFDLGKVIDETQNPQWISTGDISGKDGELITIVVNEGTGTEGTVWSYDVQVGEEGYAYKNISKAEISELKNNETYLYPYDLKTKLATTMSKKDFILNLMKVLDGVIESRPLLIESEYEYLNKKGELINKSDTAHIIDTRFKDYFGNSGVDFGVNEVYVDFSNYGMNRVYVNPNVYELYFREALNNSVITSNIFKKEDDVKELMYDVNTEELEGKTPKWSKELPFMRINTISPRPNDGEHEILDETRVFGKSWTDITKSDSKEITEGDFKYEDYEYFLENDLSYIDAVMMAYRGINAYSDEKLPQKEVDTIMSMYSVNYGNISEQETSALNYLIAKGIIDGDNASKYTSTDKISVEDAMVLIYRVANSSARLTFKTIFAPTDEAMLERGFAQTTMSVNGYEDKSQEGGSSLPEVEFISEDYDYYYTVSPSNSYYNVDYKLATDKGEYLDTSLYSVEDTTLKVDELKLLGYPSTDFDMKAKIYKVRGDVKFDKIGLYKEPNGVNPKWIELTIGGGLHYINSATVKKADIDARFLNVSRGIYTHKDLQEFDFTQKVAKNNPVDKLKEYTGKIFSGDENEGDSDPNIEPANDVDRKEQEEINDDNDPDDILSYRSSTLNLPKYFNDGQTDDNIIKIIMGLNTAAIADTFFDGIHLFTNGEINTELLTTLQDTKDASNSVTNIEIIPAPAEADETKTFIQFTFNRSGKRSVEDLTSMVKRRMTLNGDWTIVGGDVSAYTSASKGATMISQKELQTFGISSTPEEPDILYHNKTETYAYLNPEKDYALISNAIVDFPKDTTMIQISADEIYYNIEVVMSMLNSKDFYVFNDQGKYEVVSTMKNIAVTEIYNPESNEVIDNSFVADVTDGNLINQGKFLNLSAVSGTANTFLTAVDKSKKSEMVMYGFEPYYFKAPYDGTASADQIYHELTYEAASVIKLENILINNAILREEFDMPLSSPFVYTDNALKVTSFTKDYEPKNLAENFLTFVDKLVDNKTENDMKAYAKSMNDSLSVTKTKSYSLNTLLDESDFVSEDGKVKKLISNAKNSIEIDMFWALYFISKFKVEIIGGEGISASSLKTEFEEELVEQFNKKYSPKAVTVSKMEDLRILETQVSGDTDIADIRKYYIYPMKKVNQNDSANQSYLSVDKNYYWAPNDSLYVKLKDFSSNTAMLEPATNLDNMDLMQGSFRLPQFAANINGKINASQMEQLQYQSNSTGTGFYLKGGRLFNSKIQRYASLPEGEKPLELHDNGTVFYLKNDGSGTVDSFVVINNAVAVSNSGDEFGNLMVKVAKVRIKEISTLNMPGDNQYEQMYNYYKDPTNYQKSITALGSYAPAVHKYSEGMTYTINSAELDNTSYTASSTIRAYFNADTKDTNTVNIIPTDMSNNLANTKFMPLHPRNMTSLERMKSGDNTASIRLYPTLRSNNNKYSYSNLKTSKFDYLGALGETKSLKYYVYDSFLFDYGKMSLDSLKYGSLNERSKDILSSKPVLNDLVNTLVRELDLSRADVKFTTVGDLVSGDNLQLPSYGNNTTTLVKTSDSNKNGFSEFITKDIVGNSITPSEAQYSNVVVLKNINWLDGIKLPTNKEKSSLYHFIGNKQLGLAEPKDLNEQRGSLNLQNVLDSPILTERVSSRKVSMNEFTFYSDGKSTTTSIPNASRETAYHYFVELFLDSNLIVIKNSNDVYEIVGYSSDILVNTKGWVSRQSKFEGVTGSLLSVLPTFSGITMADLGFDDSRFSMEWFKQLFTKEYWTKLLNNSVPKLEQFLSTLGLLYLYLVLAVALFVYSSPKFLLRWTFDPLSVLTLGKVNQEALNLKDLVPKIIISIMLLSLTYGGFIRIILLKVTEVVQVIRDIAIYPFL